jgi:glutamine amidotransferase
MRSVGVVMLPYANVASIDYWAARSGCSLQHCATPADLAQLDALVLPGVGSFDCAMAYLEQTGFASAIRDFAAAGKPLLGICLGMQVLFDSSEEGQRAGLGILPSRIVRLPGGADRVPNIGWRETRDAATVRCFYFMHSFCLPAAEAALLESSSLSACNGGFVASFRHANVFGYQFHPEKSYSNGDAVLQEFLGRVANA